ncbi:MAG: CBASS cGAMP-activated phospholipase [Thermodesulfobacteriota bacterium]
MKKILSLDGGGIRGIIPAIILAEFEKNIGKPVSEAFDLIAGTSTGGILAMGLTIPGTGKKPKFKAKDLISIYEKDGRSIFDRSFWQGVSSGWGWTEEKYSHKNLDRVLNKYFGKRTLKSALTNVLISSYELEERRPFFFKSWRKEYNAYEMKKVARATSAAPTFFEPLQLKHKNKKIALVDGGVFVNNPAVSAYAEAVRIYPDEKEFIVISLGTGQLTRPIHYDDAKDWGMVSWVKPVIDVVLDGVSDAVDYQLEKILDKNFYRFQTELDIGNDDMDDASRANIEALKMEAAQILTDSENRKKLTEIYKILKK